MWLAVAMGTAVATAGLILRMREKADCLLLTVQRVSRRQSRHYVSSGDLVIDSQHRLLIDRELGNCNGSDMCGEKSGEKQKYSVRVYDACVALILQAV